MKVDNFKTKFLWIVFIFLNINIIDQYRPSYGFVPNIYKPKETVLENTSIGIGLTSNELLKYGQNKTALGLAKLALSLNPKEVELWIILANAELNSNLLDEALLSIRKGKEINPNLSILWFTEANIEIQKGNINSAIKSINKSLAINKNNANAYFLLGNANLILEKYNLSQDAFEKAININPKFWQALNNQGLIYFETGEKELAIKIWRKVLKIKADPETKLALAIALYSIEPNNKESIVLAKEALQQNPNYFFEAHQKDQLWGKRLRTAGVELFRNPKLKSVINTASANSNFTNSKEQ